MDRRKPGGWGAAGIVVWIKVEPKFAPVRSDPRFQDLPRRLKLV